MAAPMAQDSFLHDAGHVCGIVAECHHHTRQRCCGRRQRRQPLTASRGAGDGGICGRATGRGGGHRPAERCEEISNCHWGRRAKLSDCFRPPIRAARVPHPCCLGDIAQIPRAVQDQGVQCPRVGRPILWRCRWPPGGPRTLQPRAGFRRRCNRSCSKPRVRGRNANNRASCGLSRACELCNHWPRPLSESPGCVGERRLLSQSPHDAPRRCR